MTRWSVGTVGFGYDDWRGAFYPHDLARPKWLSYYAEHFDFVELDTTFHALPTRERIEGWRDAVPRDFRFGVKATRTITHDRPLREAGEHLRDLAHVLRPMGEKLAVVLLQFPPALPVRLFEEWVDSILGNLIHDVPWRYAVEFRAPEWWEFPPLRAALREHRVALVAADVDGRVAPVAATTDFAYVRLIGVHGRYEPMDHERLDATPALRTWVDDVAASGVKHAYALLNNDYAGFAIGTANKFRALVDQPVAEFVRETLF